MQSDIILQSNAFWFRWKDPPWPILVNYHAQLVYMCVNASNIVQLLHRNKNESSVKFKLNCVKFTVLIFVFVGISMKFWMKPFNIAVCNDVETYRCSLRIGFLL